MEFKGIPHGHLYIPDPSVTRTITPASLKELDELISKSIANQSIDYTDLEDIDDTMDMDLAKIGLVECNIPEIPDGYTTSNEEMKQCIQKALQATEEYLKREEKNETNC